MDIGLLRLAASTLALAALAGAAHAAGADADAPQATAQATAQPSTVAPVTITAERRTVNLQTAPVAASVLSGSQLQAQGIDRLDDLQFHTPSLTVTDFGQGNLFNIRGIGKDLTNVQTPSGVVTYWDGVAAFPGFFQDAPYYDIANVEVLRGPQGTFAGQNATGGAVFITTNDASLHGYSGDIQAGYGNYDDAQVQGFVNMPLSDTAALRVAFDGEHRDSFFRVSGPFTTPFGGAPGRLLEGSVQVGLTWQPTDALKVLLKGDYNYVDHGGYLASPTLNLANPAQLNPTDPFDVATDADNYGTNKFYRLSANVAYTLADGIVLRSISGYQYGITNQGIDLDGTANPALGFTFTDYATERVISQEFNVVSPDQGPLRWVGGLYFQSDVVDIPQGGFDIGVPPGVVDIGITYHTPKTTDAVFGQVTYDLTPALQLEAGARFTHSTFKLTDSNQTFVLGALVANLPLQATTDDNAVTGKVALTWRPTPDNSFYAFAAEGHKQNGINTDPATPFGPEEVTDFEAGWKPTFADGHVRAQLGGYYSIYRHFQLQFTQGNQTNLIQNLQGDTIVYGLEAEAQARLGALSLEAGASYEHSRLGAALITDPNVTPPAPVQLGGRPLPLAPAWTFNVGGQYDIALPNGATLTPDLDYSYVSSQWATPFQHFGELLPARNLVNAQLTYAQGDWRATLYANNAFDQHYIVAVNVGVPFELRYPGNPRQFGFRIARRF
ncbi:MAG TPA: TonB-dependent receptor [Caulobacteraceae bacterium]|jgi:iron complex outermembrane receptor protein